MDHAQMEQAVMEAIVSRKLEEIQQDPKRSIRQLVDLGQEAAVSALSRRFLFIAQNMLQQADSPYYTLIENAVEAVDQKRLLRFGVNLFWNGLTKGAGRIRQLEEQRGYNIPWTVSLYLKQTESGLSLYEQLDLIRQGTEMGIYTYMLFCLDAPAVERAMTLANKEPECAFFLMLPGGWEWKPDVSPEQIPQNLLLGVDCGAPGWEEQVRWLKEGRCLYLLYRRYATEQDAQEILSGQWVEAMLPYGGVAVVLLQEAKGLNEAHSAAVRDYALQARMNQRYPTFVIDFYADTLFTDQLVSGDACFAGFLADGTLTEYRDGREVATECSLRTAPLEQLFQRFPKT